MATTTNYSWSTPDDTALVKDGAAAIRSLGTSIDTTTKALNPSTTLGDIEYRSSSANTNTRLPIGTTGQVLAVVGGVPAWATTADQTPLTTKGDLFTFDTADARLGVGANGTVLTADSAEATGLKWATPSAGGGWQVVKAETTFTSVASTGTTFDSIFSSSYNYYMVQIKALGGGTAATDDLQLQMLYSGTTQTSGYYGTTFGNAHGGASPASVGTSNAAQFTVSPDASGAATTGDRITGVINFYQCQGVSSHAAFQGQLLQGYNYSNYVFAGQSSTARTFTGFLLKASSGNISGTLAVYGLA
jgi:hypothetical protein